MQKKEDDKDESRQAMEKLERLVECISTGGQLQTKHGRACIIYLTGPIEKSVNQVCARIPCQHTSVQAE